ncbi:hypothetical protein N9L47_08980 [Rhodobacteraceae bacterium]|nr:hypothetical protein [Paracoccaceae bacterium]
MEHQNDNRLIINFNLLGVLAAYVLLGISIWITDIPLSAKGFWGIGILMLTLSLVNFVKYRFDDRLREDRLQRLEDAKNEKLLEEYVTDKG